MCASPDYIAQTGQPADPAELTRFDCIVHGTSLEGQSWTFFGASGRLSVPVRGRIAVNSLAFVMRAAIEGLGIAMLPEPVALPHLRTGRLVGLLEAFEPPPTSINLVYPSSRHLSAATRAFIDFATALGAHPTHEPVATSATMPEAAFL